MPLSSSACPHSIALLDVFGTVKAIQEAKDSGKLRGGDDWSNFVDELLNLQDSRFAKAVESETEGMLTGVNDRSSFLGENGKSTSGKDAETDNGQRPFLATDAGRGDRCHHSISEAAKAHKFGIAVQVKERDFYNDPANKLFLGLDDQAGAAVTADTDLVSVFKHPAAKGSIAPLLDEAASNALTLDGLDVGGKLPDLYAVFGFRPVARVAFNRGFAPEAWDYDLAGEPDVDVMERDFNGGKTGMKAGTLRAALTSAIASETDMETVSALGKLRRWMTAIRKWRTGRTGRSGPGAGFCALSALSRLAVATVLFFCKDTGMDGNDCAHLEQH
jgi:hypothetical protein